MNLITAAINRIKQFGAATGIVKNAYRVMYYGTFNEISYSNFKHDPRPLIFVMYSGTAYTHGLNIHYMSYEDKMWLGNLIISFKKRNQMINGRMLYRVIKTQRPSIVRSCYRKYFTKNIISPRMVCAGFTPMERYVLKTNDGYIKQLNGYLNNNLASSINVNENKLTDEELRRRVIIARNAKPVGTASNVEAISKPTQVTTPSVTTRIGDN